MVLVMAKFSEPSSGPACSVLYPQSAKAAALISFLTGMEVAAGFVLLMMVFFSEAFVLRAIGEDRPEKKQKTRP